MSGAPYRPSDEVDFLIIGAGAAGGVLARELSVKGFSVVVLEQGPFLKEKDFPHDDFAVFYQAALTNDHRRQPNTFRETEDQQAVVQPAVEYGRMVGGGSVHFTSNYWRFHESDFRERSEWGSIPGSSLADWPLTYAELEPYYSRAEWEIGVSGLAGANPFEAPRSKPYPLPPMPAKPSGLVLDRAMRRLGLNPFPAPVAILSQPYRGRGACIHCGYCEGFGCEVRAKSSTLVSMVPGALKTGRCDLRPNSYVRRIRTGPGGRVTGAVYFDARRREIFQRAKAVIVSANGAETPRLLLMSADARHPHGLANGNGQVGRNLMFDNWAYAMGLFPHPMNEYKSIVTTRVSHDLYNIGKTLGCYGGAGMDVRFDFTPVSFALDGLPADIPAWGAARKKALAHYFTHSSGLLAHCSCLPRESNSISLDPGVKDDWGLPAMRVTFRNHDDDFKVMHYFRRRMIEILDAAGASKTWAMPVANVSFSRHLMGTCRMGADPKTSVINSDHRTHEVPNLFLVDGSSFVTCARQQPTETIQALAFRASDRIAALARTNSI